MSQLDWDNVKQILMALFMAFLAWQNKRLGDQGKTVEVKLDQHEQKATARALMRGDPIDPCDPCSLPSAKDES